MATPLLAGSWGKGQQWRSNIIRALEAPIKVAKSIDEKRTEFYEGRLAQVKFTREQMALGEQLERQLEAIEEEDEGEEEEE